MTIRKLASELAKREGKKSQARVGDVRELLKLLCEMEADAAVTDPLNSDSPMAALHDRIDILIARKKEKEARRAKRSNSA